MTETDTPGETKVAIIFFSEFSLQGVCPSQMYLAKGPVKPAIY
jgi:hypothetical protein